jgi:hypothetical protein
MTKLDVCKTTWVTIIGALSLLSAPVPAFAQHAEDDKLNSFFKSYLEEHFRQQPLQATSLGDHRFDSQLDNITPKAREGWLAFARKTLEELPKQVDYKKLSRDGQIDFEIFQHNLQTEIWETKNFHPFEEDPRTYGAYISDAIYLLLTQSTLPKETNIANCIARMAQLPRIVAEAEKTLTHPPKPILQTAILQNRGAIDFYESELFQFAGDTPQPGQLKAAAAAVAALLKEYQKFLEGPLLARATGEWRIGRAKFDKKFELETEAGITAEQNLADAGRNSPASGATCMTSRANFGASIIRKSRSRPTTRKASAKPSPKPSTRSTRNTASRRIWSRTPAPPSSTSRISSAKKITSSCPTLIFAR